MRELNPQEIEAVSGAGFLANSGKSIGQSLGYFVDSLFPKGVQDRFKDGLGLLGSSIGYLFEFNLKQAGTDFTEALKKLTQTKPTDTPKP